MQTPFINFSLSGMLILLLLQGCTTTSPTEDRVVETAVNVPAEARAQFKQAVSLLKAGQQSVALTLFQQLAQRYPQLAGVQVNLGIIHLQNDKLEEAIATLQKAVQLNPDNAVAQHHLGIALRKSGQFVGARSAYLQALKIDPQYAGAHLNLAILYDLYLQQLPAALEHYRQFQQLSGSDDPEVSKWIIDLERRIDNQNSKPQGDS